MAAIGNLIWFLFLGGLFMGLAWILLGVLLCCTVVGLPFGIAAFRIAGFAFLPFGKELIDARLLGESRIPGTTIANVLWIVLAGIWLAIGHIVAGLGCFLSCVLILPLLLGAPAWGVAHFNLAAISFAPLGMRAVPKSIADEARRRGAGLMLR
jgi:uncharacterized membrane protein YccF (DUF307 family)